MTHEITIRPGGAYDLIVAGGGMSGVSCAIAAARQGLKVLLVEKENCLGGTASASGVMHLLGGRRYDAEKDCMVREVGGLFDEMTDELIAMGYAVDPDTIDVHHNNPFGWYPRMAAGVACDVDFLKYYLEHKCLDAGVTIRYGMTVVDAVMAGAALRSLIVHGKEGFLSLEATLFADCTGDADVAALCGCPTQLGLEEDNACCPATLMFYVDGVDGDAYVAYQNEHQSPKLVEIIEQLKKDGQWPYPFEIFIAIQTPAKDVFMVNTVRQTEVDGTSSASLTHAVMDGRRLAYELTAIMRQHFPGFANARVCRIFDRMGVRESRRILAREMISLQDALEGRHWEDCVASTTYTFDLPDPKRPSYDAMMGDVKKPHAARKHTVIEIPYGALLPQGADNLIVAGRCLGAAREVMGACRVMGPCTGMGQAAGYAAKLALAGGRFDAVDAQTLRAWLKRDGCIGCR